MANEIVLFTDGDLQLEVPVSSDGESVWLSANQMAQLFDKDETTVRKHINNVFKTMEVDKVNNTQKMRVVGVRQPIAFYSLDVIAITLMIAESKPEEKDIMVTLVMNLLK